MFRRWILLTAGVGLGCSSPLTAFDRVEVMLYEGGNPSWPHMLVLLGKEDPSACPNLSPDTEATINGVALRIEDPGTSRPLAVLDGDPPCSGPRLEGDLPLLPGESMALLLRDSGDEIAVRFTIPPSVQLTLLDPADGVLLRGHPYSGRLDVNATPSGSQQLELTREAEPFARLGSPTLDSNGQFTGTVASNATAGPANLWAAVSRIHEVDACSGVGSCSVSEWGASVTLPVTIK